MSINDELSQPTNPCEHNRNIEHENIDIDEVLKDVDALLRPLARKNLPHSIVLQEVEDLEEADLAQRALIKLWLAMRKEPITHYRAYARRIIHNESIDMLRQHKPTSQLPLNEDGELEQGLLVLSNTLIDDPADEVEFQDTVKRYIAFVVDDVLDLPQQQRCAMICELKNKVADMLPIAEAFSRQGVNISEINWSQDKNELQSQRASLSIARKKMRAVKEKYLSL